MAQPIVPFPRRRREGREKDQTKGAPPELRVIEGGESEREAERRRAEERLARRERRRRRTRRTAARKSSKSPFGLW